MDMTGDVDHPHEWRLVQITELLQASRSLIDNALQRLAGVSAEIPANALVRLDSAHVAEVEQLIADLNQLVWQVQDLSAYLPIMAVTLTHAGAADGALAALRDGMLSPENVVWAARLAHFPEGWQALAEGLRSTDACRGWDELTVKQLAGAFRGVSPQLAQHVALTAQLAPDLPPMTPGSRTATLFACPRFRRRSFATTSARFSVARRPARSSRSRFPVVPRRSSDRRLLRNGSPARDCGRSG